MAGNAYRLDVTRSAEKDLRHMVASDRRRVVAAILALADPRAGTGDYREPRPSGCLKMTDQEEYRIRVGDFRITYAIEDGARRVTIYRAAHRRDVYR